MDRFGEIEEGDEFIEELVIACELSEESAEVARELIKIWIEANTSYSDMERAIEKIIYDRDIYPLYKPRSCDRSSRRVGKTISSNFNKNSNQLFPPLILV
jgi:hypothetical protein